MSKPTVVGYLEAARATRQIYLVSLREQFDAMVVAVQGLDGPQTYTEPVGGKPGHVDVWVCNEQLQLDIRCGLDGYLVNRSNEMSPARCDTLELVCEFLADEIARFESEPQPPPPPKTPNSRDRVLPRDGK